MSAEQMEEEQLATNRGKIRFSVESINHALKRSANTYEPPIKPRPGESVRFWQDSPSHVGAFAHAVDIIIPDPRENPLPVYAPQSGKIIALVQENDVFGDGPEFGKFTNYITIEAPHGEFFEICHIGRGSVNKKVGDEVQKGEELAKTGANGWMTDVRHIHMLVGKWDKSTSEGFHSLKIRFES